VAGVVVILRYPPEVWTCILTMVFYVFWSLKAPTDRRERARGPYPEYETPANINNRWGKTPEAKIPCDFCGMDDEPIFRYMHNKRCKWCAELYELTKHLKKHGRRRLTKAA
jgi:hypothetical protein